MRIVYPSIAETDVASAYATPLGRRPDRPWVMLSMVASIDGSTVVGGRSEALSNPTDITVLSQLRSIADVVIVGAATAAGEGYGPPRKASQRIGVVTRSGSVDTTTDLFRSGAGFVVTTEDAVVDPTSAGDSSVDVLRCGQGDVDLHEMVRRIPEVCPGASVIQAEGGPRLNGSFAEADLLDELDITTSPGIVGGGGPRLVAGAADVSSNYALEQMAIDESFVFTRWRRRR